MMDRRRLIALFGGATAAWPLQLRAQQPGRTYRIGALALLPRDSPAYVALFEGLRRQGFVERQNLTIDPRGFGLHVEQFSDVAAQLVKAQVEVILPVGDAAIRAAQQATATIPILAIADDMLGAGLITSLAHPGGNTTGISILATELDGKRQQLLIELIPGVRRIAALVDSNTKAAGQLEALGDAARARGIELSLHRVAEPDEIVGAIDAAQAAGASASTCCRHRSWAASVSSLSSERQCCACQLSINGRKPPRRAGSPAMAHASSRSGEMRWPGSSLSCCKVSSPPICRSSSRPNSSSCSTSKPQGPWG
jgi:hypothetical protein